MVVIQDTNMFKNYKCFEEAVNYSYDESTFRLCQKNEHLVYFKLIETDGEQSLDVSRVVSLSRYQEIGRLGLFDQVKMDYETLWSVSFALENTV